MLVDKPHECHESYKQKKQHIGGSGGEIPSSPADGQHPMIFTDWSVSSPLKNISQLGYVGIIIPNIWKKRKCMKHAPNHQPVWLSTCFKPSKLVQDFATAQRPKVRGKSVHRRIIIFNSSRCGSNAGVNTSAHGTHHIFVLGKEMNR